MKSNQTSCLCSNVVLVAIAHTFSWHCLPHHLAAQCVPSLLRRLAQESPIGHEYPPCWTPHAVSVSVPCEKTDVSLYETSCILLLRNELVDLRFMASSGTVE